MAEPSYVYHVEVRFPDPEHAEFTDDDYYAFGCGDIERGKRAVDKVLDAIAKRIDAHVLEVLSDT